MDVLALGSFKPLLSALLLPPVSPLLLALLGCFAWRWPIGRGMVVVGLLLLWGLGCTAVAAVLQKALVPGPDPIQPQELARAQAVVVLGGGIARDPMSLDGWGPNAATLQRLHTGARLAHRHGLPLAFAGGVGWVRHGTDAPDEAQAAAATLAGWGLAPRWLERRSRDTAENAARLAPLLHADGVKRFALVTHATHLPRARWHFEREGFEVLPVAATLPEEHGTRLLDWLPSVQGLHTSREVLRERLGLAIAQRVNR